LRWLAVVTALLFCIWMFLFAMWCSGLFGLLLTYLVAPLPKGRVLRTRWRKRSLLGRAGITTAILFATALFIHEVALPEYAAEARRLGCVARGAFAGQEPPLRMPDWCGAPRSYRRPADDTGPVFSTREHLAISGFNLVLAAGGALSGFPEVAWETLALNFVDEPIEELSNLPLRNRWRRCQPGASRGVEPLRRESDFAMASPTIRSAVASLAARAAQHHSPGPLELGRVAVRWPQRSGSTNALYRHLAREDSLRTALALWVPGAHLTGQASDTDQGTRLDLQWQGEISYPVKPAFRFRLDTLIRSEPVVVVVDEGIFCGAAMDGWFTPYPLQWSWSIMLPDERLTPENLSRAEPTLAERLLGAVLATHR